MWNPRIWRVDSISILMASSGCGPGLFWHPGSLGVPFLEVTWELPAEWPVVTTNRTAPLNTACLRLWPGHPCTAGNPADGLTCGIRAVRGCVRGAQKGLSRGPVKSSKPDGGCCFMFLFLFCFVLFCFCCLYLPAT